MSEAVNNETETVSSSLSEEDVVFMRKMGGKTFDTISLANLRGMRLGERGWEAHGLCGQSVRSPDSSVHPDDFLGGDKNSQLRLIAKFCFHCPVIDDCRLAAVQSDHSSETKEILGLQGGQTQYTRREQARYNRLLTLSGSDSLAVFPIDKASSTQYRPSTSSVNADAQKLRDETPPPNYETEVALTDLAMKLQTTKHTVRGLVRRNEVKTTLHYDSSGQKRSYISKEDARLIEEIIAGKPGSMPRGYEDVDQLESQRRRQDAFISNYRSFFNGELLPDGNSVTLRDHQHSTFEQIGSLLQKPAESDGSRKICIPYAPSCGKTVIGAMCAKAGGVGADGLKALVLVPGVTTLEQTAGSGLGKGFELVAPELRVGTYWADSKDLEGDVTIMTYKSFIGLADEVRAKLNDCTTLLILDEAHRATGSLTSQKLKDFTKGKITLAMAATPEFSSTKGVRSTLGIGNEVEKISTRRAIEDGIANGVQVFLLASGQELRINSRHGRISEVDLQPLRANQSRDELILELIRYMSEEGRTGIIKCVRGDSSQHARQLADQANKMKFWDSEAEEMRFVRAAAVGNFQTNSQNRSLIEAFENRHLDALLFTDYLKEGYDSELVEYVVGAEPSTSRVETEQLFGRGMRPKDKLTLYFQIVDKYVNSRKPAVTFIDILDHAKYETGSIIGKPAKLRWKRVPQTTPSDEQDRKDMGAISLESLPNQLRLAAEMISGALVDEMTVVAEKFQDPPPDWIHWRELSIHKKVSDTMVREILSQRLNIPIIRARGGLYVPPDTEERLAEYNIPEAAETSLVPFQQIRNNLGLSGDLMDKIVLTLGLQVIVRRSNSKTKRRAHFLSSLDYERLEAFIRDEYPRINPQTDVAITDIAHQLNRDRVTVRVFLARNKKQMYSRYDDRRYEHLCVDPETAEWAKGQMGVRIPDDCVILNEETVKIIKKSPLKKYLQNGRVRGGKVVWWLPREYTA